MKKEEIENRIKDMNALIVEQGKSVQQINNNILMVHGARQEMEFWLNKTLEQEKIDAEKAESERAEAEKQVLLACLDAS